MNVYRTLYSPYQQKVLSDERAKLAAKLNKSPYTNNQHIHFQVSFSNDGEGGEGPIDYYVAKGMNDQRRFDEAWDVLFRKWDCTPTLNGSEMHFVVPHSYYFSGHCISCNLTQGLVCQTLSVTLLGILLALFAAAQ